jgi:hypothetical protein
MSKLSLLITACVALLIAVHQVIVGTTHELIPLAPLLLSPARLVARNNSTITSHKTEEDVKVLLFITTIFSQNHQNYFDCCWPRLMKKSKLLQRAHVLIFSNNVTAIDPHIIEHTQQLFSKNPSFAFQFAPQHELQALADLDNKVQTFQVGANLGMKLGVAEGWFAEYDWMVRINPDVLIRDSRWIWEMMQVEHVDGIMVHCNNKPPRIHTDFFAVRPNRLSSNAFSQLQKEPYSKNLWNHEITAFYEFQGLRTRPLPNVYPSNNFCRVRGERSPVTHGHTSCRNSSMICDALEGWDVV